MAWMQTELVDPGRIRLLGQETTYAIVGGIGAQFKGFRQIRELKQDITGS